jgi:hypothetical protein
MIPRLKEASAFSVGEQPSESRSLAVAGRVERHDARW